jgi:hypothetical protein
LTYHGQHRLAYASEKFRTAFGRLFFQFADNLCPVVVDSVSNRLKIIDFKTENGSDGLGKTAWKYWQQQRMYRKSKEIHREVLKTGDAYVIIWPDPETGVPTIYPQLAEQMTVFYNDEVPGLLMWAAKSWQNQDQFIRLNMYYPDRIEKWITIRKMAAMPVKSQFWTKFVEPGEAWPLMNPWGTVPVFHFVNNAPPGKFGRSELKDVLPLQDALNKAVIDLLVAMEYVSFPQRYAVGMELEINEDTGLPMMPFQPSVDRLWTVADDKVKFGEFNQADLSQMLAVQKDLRLEIARVSETPLHYMMSMEMPPSGDALKTLEEPLIRKVEDRQSAMGDTWADAVIFALRAQGLATNDETVCAVWADASPKSGLEDAQTLQIKKAIGVSTNKCLQEMGYTESEIDQIHDDNSKDAQLQSQLGMTTPTVMPPSGRPRGQAQPPGNTSPSVSPHADGQRMSMDGGPTLRVPLKNG